MRPPACHSNNCPPRQSGPIITRWFILISQKKKKRKKKDWGVKCQFVSQFLNLELHFYIVISEIIASNGVMPSLPERAQGPLVSMWWNFSISSSPRGGQTQWESCNKTKITKLSLYSCQFSTRTFTFFHFYIFLYAMTVWKCVLDSLTNTRL